MKVIKSYQVLTSILMIYTTQNLKTFGYVLILSFLLARRLLMPGLQAIDLNSIKKGHFPGTMSYPLTALKVVAINALLIHCHCQ